MLADDCGSNESGNQPDACSNTDWVKSAWMRSLDLSIKLQQQQQLQGNSSRA